MDCKCKTDMVSRFRYERAKAHLIELNNENKRLKAELKQKTDAIDLALAVIEKGEKQWCSGSQGQRK